MTSGLPGSTMHIVTSMRRSPPPTGGPSRFPKKTHSRGCWRSISNEPLRIPWCAHAVRRSRGVIVHSEFGRRYLEEFGCKTPVFVVPHPPVWTTTGNKSQARFLDLPGMDRGLYSEPTAEKIDSEIKRIVTEAHDKARTILSANREKLESAIQSDAYKPVLPTLLQRLRAVWLQRK